MGREVGDIVSSGPLEGCRIIKFFSNYSDDRCVEVQWDGDGDTTVELTCKLYMESDYKARPLVSKLKPAVPSASPAPTIITPGAPDEVSDALRTAFNSGEAVNVKEFGYPEKDVRKNIDKLRRRGMEITSLGKGRFQVK